MKSKPLFNWAQPPDGQKRPARELLDHCVKIQKFYLLLVSRVGQPERDLVLTAYASEIKAIKKAAIEIGIQVVEPQWFSRLFQ